MTRRLRSLAAWLLLAALAALAFRFEARRTSGESVPTGAIHIIDGDSFRIGGREIRLAGIDAPEYRQTCSEPGGGQWPCGREAREALAALAKQKPLDCTKAAEDRFGRALARCRTPSGDIASALAKEGWAVGARDPRFPEPSAEIAEARRAKRGIWRGSHQHPADWRKAASGT